MLKRLAPDPHEEMAQRLQDAERDADTWRGRALAAEALLPLKTGPGFTHITITAGYERPDGTAAQGYVLARLTTPVTNNKQQADTTPLRGVLTAEGLLQDQSEAPFVLVANDDTETTPKGSAYEFTLLLDGLPPRMFYAVVPHAAAGGTIDLSELEP